MRKILIIRRELYASPSDAQNEKSIKQIKKYPLFRSSGKIPLTSTLKSLTLVGRRSKWSILKNRSPSRSSNAPTSLISAVAFSIRIEQKQNLYPLLNGLAMDTES